MKVRLSPVEGIAPEAITEACDSQRQQRPHLESLVKQRLEQLANNTEVSDDDDAFFAAAENLLDTRTWSDFQVLIRRRQSGERQIRSIRWLRRGKGASDGLAIASSAQDGVTAVKNA